MLRKVEEGGYASDLLLKLSAKLESRDAGLASEIVFGCLRYQAQLDYLIREGCDESQGYLHSRPVSRLDLERLLSTAVPMARVEQKLLGADTSGAAAAGTRRSAS